MMINYDFFVERLDIFAAPITQHPMERCQSGSMCLIRNQVYCQRYRGFESLPLRIMIQIAAKSLIFSRLFSFELLPFINSLNKHQYN